VGWSPVSRSMIESRRAAIATGPSTYSPKLSGPRWTSVALIAAMRSRSAGPWEEAIPQIPHMQRSVGGAYPPEVHFSTHDQLLLLALLAIMAALLIAAPAARIPFPVFLVLGGLGIGFVPGMPTIQLPPDVVLVAFLPPHLYVSAYNTSLRDLRQNARTIGLLAIGLVIATTFAGAAVAPWAIYGF